MEEFILLLNDFLANKITIQVFEQKYMQLWRNWRDLRDAGVAHLRDQEAKLIDDLFSAVDAYSSKPPFHISEGQLREIVGATHDELVRLRNFSGRRDAVGNTS